MNLLQFTFNHAVIRGIEEEGEHWFVAPDAAHVLGYFDPPGVVGCHCTGPLRWLPLEVRGAVEQVRLLDKVDLVRLIVGSVSTAALRCGSSVRTEQLRHVVRNWNDDDSNPHELLNDATVLQALLHHYREQSNSLQLQIPQQVCEAIEIDMTSALPESLNLQEAADELHMSLSDLIDWMQENEWLYQLPSGEWTAHPSRVLEGDLV